MIRDITSSSNDKIKYVKSLSLRKNREKNAQFITEGVRSVEEAIMYADVASVFVTEGVVDKLDLSGIDNVYRVPEFIFQKISETNSPQGVLAVVNMKSCDREYNASGAYVYCDNIRDPGNLGTIIRTADAAGFDGVILSSDTVDPYNPKVVRASMGSFYRMNIFEGVALSELSDFKIYGGVLSDDIIDYREADYSGGIVIVVGNEANGISDENKSLLSGVKIPIYGGAESLNAAVAAAIMMYEAANVRKDKTNE